jgi:hypothetical protein
MPKLSRSESDAVQERVEGGARVSVWYARFRSQCAYGDHIEADDPVVWIDGEVAHAQCAEDHGAELIW